MKITDQQLAAVLPYSTAALRARYLGAFAEALPAYDIDTPHRVRAFLAIVGHETGHLRTVEENLHYSAAGLRGTFPKYFPDDATAAAYARQPERIANRVYAGRMGNGDEASGDGWKYRGRGLLQITGRANYRLLAGLIPCAPDFERRPDEVATPRYATQASAAWWKNGGINQLADRLAYAPDEYGAFRRIVRGVNGGYNGLAERWEIYLRAKRYIV